MLNGLPHNPVAWSGYLLEFSECSPSFPKRFVELLPTCNVTFKRTVFERYGLFPAGCGHRKITFLAGVYRAPGSGCSSTLLSLSATFFGPTSKSFVQHQLRHGRGSAIARRQVEDLPYAWVVEHPLRWLPPLLRLARIEARLVRWDWQTSCVLTSCCPSASVACWHGALASILPAALRPFLLNPESPAREPSQAPVDLLRGARPCPPQHFRHGQEHALARGSPQSMGRCDSSVPH